MLAPEPCQGRGPREPGGDLSRPTPVHSYQRGERGSPVPFQEEVSGLLALEEPLVTVGRSDLGKLPEDPRAEMVRVGSAGSVSGKAEREPPPV